MKIGLFDSGLGGLVIAKAVRDALPDYDLVYLGDTLHVPYGSRSQEAVLRYTRNSIDYLFKQDCQLVILACNTASAIALRHIQQNYLKQSYPDRRVLGVIIPTLETCLESGYKRIGLLATERIVESAIYKTELEKLDQGIRLYQKAAPLLVPAIELGSHKWIRPLLVDYLQPLLEENIECLILGCTHYSFLKDIFEEEAGSGVSIISQDDIIPAKLKDYLRRHPEIDRLISKGGSTEFQVTDITEAYMRNAEKVFSGNLTIGHVVLGEV